MRMGIVMLMKNDACQRAGNLSLEFAAQFTGIDRFLRSAIARPAGVLQRPSLHPCHQALSQEQRLAPSCRAGRPGSAQGFITVIPKGTGNVRKYFTPRVGFQRAPFFRRASARSMLRGWTASPGSFNKRAAKSAEDSLGSSASKASIMASTSSFSL